MELKDQFTLLIASIGAVLGILNTIYSQRRDLVKLKVSPRLAMIPLPSGMDHRLVVGVTNLSLFEVEVEAVGFTFKGAKGGKFIAILPTNAFETEFVQLPLRMKPRSSASFYVAHKSERTAEFSKIKRALIRTTCGRVFTASSPALKSYVSAVRQVEEESED